MTPEEIIESGQLELYALQALPLEEMAEVEAMAARFPAVQAALTEQFAVLEKYATLHATEPPAHLQSRINNAIDALPKDAKIHQLKPEKDEPKEQEGRQIFLEPGKVSRHWWRYGFAASMALFLLSAGLNLLFYNRWKKTESQLSSLVAQNLQLAQKYHVVNQEISQNRQELALVHDPQFFPVAMNNLPNAPAARALVHWNRTSGEVILDAGDLPAPPAGKQYQLWALYNGKPVDAGVVALTTSANEMSRMKVIKAAQAFAITLEPVGGRPVPSLDQLKVMGQLPA